MSFWLSSRLLSSIDTRLFKEHFVWRVHLVSYRALCRADQIGWVLVDSLFIVWGWPVERIIYVTDLLKNNVVTLPCTGACGAYERSIKQKQGGIVDKKKQVKIGLRWLERVGALLCAENWSRTWRDTRDAVVGPYSGLLGKWLLELKTDSLCKKGEFTILCLPW